MPLYQYRCSDGHKTELLVKMSEREEEIICACGEKAGMFFATPFSVQGKTESSRIKHSLDTPPSYEGNFRYPQDEI